MTVFAFRRDAHIQEESLIQGDIGRIIGKGGCNIRDLQDSMS